MIFQTTRKESAGAAQSTRPSPPLEEGGYSLPITAHSVYFPVLRPKGPGSGRLKGGRSNQAENSAEDCRRATQNRKIILRYLLFPVLWFGIVNAAAVSIQQNNEKIKSSHRHITAVQRTFSTAHCMFISDGVIHISSSGKGLWIT